MGVVTRPFGVGVPPRERPAASSPSPAGRSAPRHTDRWRPTRNGVTARIDTDDIPSNPTILVVYRRYRWLGKSPLDDGTLHVAAFDVAGTGS